MKAILVVLLGVSLCGCASNGYKQFYKSLAPPQVVAANRANPTPEEPIVRRSSSMPDITSYLRQGYGVIGYSSFNGGGKVDEDNAIEQAEDIGADLVVIINPKYTGSRTSSVPIVTPTSNTSYTTGSATAYGYGGSATAYGNSTTTTYGSRTTYIPITTTRYDYGAVYFVKRRYTLGVGWRPLKPAERQRLQTNKGLYVRYVVNGSPAYQSDILHGDIIEAINGVQVGSAKEAGEMLTQYRGQTVTIKLVRAAKILTKSVTLNGR